MPSRYASCFSVVWIFFFWFDLQVSPSESKAVKCLQNHISWRNKTTGVIQKCTPCPPCPPSQEYSIPCNSLLTLGIDKLGKCVYCSSGKFSDGFDYEPCKVCTQCTARIYKQNCTKSQNAICGNCVEGYIYNTHILGCVKIQSEKLHTKQLSTKSATSTSVSTLTSTDIPTTSQGSTALEATARPITTTAMSIPTTPNVPTRSAAVQPWIIIKISLLCVVIVILLIIIIVMCLNRNSCKGMPYCRTCSNIKSSNEEEIAMMVPAATATINVVEDELLKNFIDKHDSEADKLFTILSCSPNLNGTWVFERVAKKYNFGRDILLKLKQQIHVENGSPGKLLCEKLCAEIEPPITVRKFAESIKDISNEAYRILKPYFVKDTSVKIISETGSKPCHV